MSTEVAESSDSIFAFSNCKDDLYEYRYNFSTGNPTNFDLDTTSMAECVNPLILSGFTFVNLIVVMWFAWKHK